MAAVVGSVVVVATLWTLAMRSALEQNEKATAHAGARARAGDRMLGAMLEQADGLRGYTLTGDRRFLQRYLAGRQRFMQLVAATSKDLGADRVGLAEQSRLADRWLKQAEPQIREVDAGGGALQGPVRDVMARERTMDQFRSANAQFQKWLRQRREDELQGSRSIALAAVVVISLLLFVGGYALVRLGSRTERRGDARFRSLVRGSSDLIAVIDAHTRVRYLSPAVEKIIGAPPHTLIGTKLIERVHPDDAEWVSRNFAAAVERRDGVDEPTICRWLHADGSYRHVEVVRDNRLGDPDVMGIVLHVRDVSGRVELERQMRHHTLHDGLTSLPNRALFEDRLARALAAGTRPAVVLLDLDNFRGLNDSRGRLAGDQLLVLLASRLMHRVRPGDTVARLEGDQFALLAESASTSEAALTHAQRLLRAIAEEMQIKGGAISVSASAGIAMAGATSRPEELIRNADIALHAAKADGAGCTRVYEPTMLSAARDRFDVEAGLRRAIAERQFVLHYQPIVAFGSAAVAGCEALLRWSHPERGLLGPAAFMEVAEKSGLMVEIGRWVAEEAARQGRAWQLRYPQMPFKMAINASHVELEQPDFVQAIAAALDAAELPADRLIVEVTESGMMRDLPTAVTKLEELKRLGVQLAIDDFGTGYSSLSYLEQLPFDILKVPKPFVDALVEDDDQYTLAQGVIALAIGLGLETIAEGVENNVQARRLYAMHANFAQGYALARPEKAATTQAFLDTKAAQARATAPGASVADGARLAWRNGRRRSTLQ